MRPSRVFVVVLLLSACGSDEKSERDIAETAEPGDTTVIETAVTETVAETITPEVTPTECTIGETIYPNGTPEPGNLCAYCDPSRDAGGWSPRLDGNTCGAGMVCSSGVCTSACFINQQIVAAGAARPENSCEVCDPQAGTNRYTFVDDGSECTGGTCIAHGCVQQPVLTTVSPTCAPNDGSGVVTLNLSSYLEAGASVTIDGVAATSVTPKNGLYEVALPALPGVTGLVDVAAKNAYGSTATLTDALDLFAGFGLVFSFQTTTTEPSGFDIGDVDQDTKADAAWVAGGKLYVGRGGNHDASFTALDIYEDAAYGGSVVIGDFTGDGIGDVLTFAGTSSHVFPGTAGAKPGAAITSPVDVNIASAAAGHFDSGDTLDFAIRRAAGSAIEVYLGAGDGTFTVGPTIAIGSDVTSVYAGQMGGDARDDIIALRYQPGGIHIAIANDSGFATPIITSLPEPQTVFVADVDGDTKNDILMTSPALSTRLYFGNGDGTLGDFVQLTSGGLVGAAAGDFNDDGTLDVVASGGPGLRLIAGRGDGSFWCTYELALDPSPYYWKTGDLDGDGKTDLVATNPNYKRIIFAIANPPIVPR